MQNLSSRGVMQSLDEVRVKGIVARFARLVYSALQAV